MLAAVPPPQTLLGELTVIPETPSRIKGGLILRQAKVEGSHPQTNCYH